MPPAEHRAYDYDYDPRAIPQSQQVRPKPLVSPTRSLSLMDYLPLHAPAGEQPSAAAAAAGTADPDERMTRVRTLIAEETRVSMLVGVAVGLELGHLLIDGIPQEE